MCKLLEQIIADVYAKKRRLPVSSEKTQKMAVAMAAEYAESRKSAAPCIKKDVSANCAEKPRESLAEIKTKEMLQNFVNGEGSLPTGFSSLYKDRGPVFYKRTPFDTYLKEIEGGVETLYDRSGIASWLYLDKTVEINAAAVAISDCVKRHREMSTLLNKKCYKYDACYIIMLPLLVLPFRDGKVMIVIDDRSRFKGFTEESIQRCIDAGISFCTVLSDCKLYDLIEQKEKEIAYAIYPSQLDGEYADWWIQ